MGKPTPDKPPEAAPPAVTFDLRDEPWIPIVRADGTAAEVSLRVALREAHLLREIRDPLPTAEFGLYRLLVALVLDVFGPRSTADLEDLMDAGQFKAEGLDEYFGQWHDRFDLFHPAHPFLQSPGMEEDPPKPLAGLLHPLPSGTNASHFHHEGEGAFAVCPAAAARLLTTVAPFMTAGGAGLSPSVNGAPPWYVLVQGRTLFETLCLNCPALPDLTPQAVGDEPPAWRGSPPVKGERRTGASIPESLTWQPRRIRLLPGPPGRCAVTGRTAPVLVREMKFAPGFGAGFEWTDPQVPYRTGDKRGVLRPEEGRAVWRDTGPIALLRAEEYQSEKGAVRFERPAVVTQFVRMHEQDMFPEERHLDLVLYGLRTDLKMKVFEWHREPLSLPARLLWKSRFHRLAQQEMERAGDVAYAIGQGIKLAYPREGKGARSAYGSLIARAQQDFWNSLRLHYDALLLALAGLPEDDTAALEGPIGTWRGAVRACAVAAFRAAVDDLDTDADALERVTAARSFFEKRLYNLLNPEKAAQAKKGRAKKGVKQ